jgi:hypothetical protein
MQAPRRRPAPIVLAVLSLLAVNATNAALLDRVGVYADYWEQSLDGDARIDGAGEGSDFSLAEDVGLDGEKGIVEVGAWIRPAGKHRLRLAGFSSSFEGSSILPGAITAGDTTLPPGTLVASRLDLDLYKAHYNYSFVNLDVVNFGLLVGADYVDGSSALTFPGGEEISSVQGGTPVVGLNLQVSPVGFFRAYVEATAAKWNVGDIDADLRDTLARVEFYMGHVFGLGAGYRKLDLKAEGDGKIDLSTDGYQLYLLLRF